MSSNLWEAINFTVLCVKNNMSWFDSPSPKPPFPSTLYCRKLDFVTCRRSRSFHCWNRLKFELFKKSSNGFKASFSFIELWIGLKISSRGSSKFQFFCEVMSVKSSNVVSIVFRQVSTSSVFKSEIRLNKKFMLLFVHFRENVLHEKLCI